MSERKSRYPGYNEARKRSHQKYMRNFVEIKVRVTPEEREQIKKFALENNESTTSFIKRAIEETMENDKKR